MLGKIVGVVVTGELSTEGAQERKKKHCLFNTWSRPMRIGRERGALLGAAEDSRY